MDYMYGHFFLFLLFVGMTARLSQACPSECECSHANGTRHLYVDCSARQLTNIPDGISQHTYHLYVCIIYFQLGQLIPFSYDVAWAADWVCRRFLFGVSVEHIFRRTEKQKIALNTSCMRWVFLTNQHLAPKMKASLRLSTGAKKRLQQELLN